MRWAGLKITHSLPAKIFQKNGTLDSGCPGSPVRMVAMNVEKTILIARPAPSRTPPRRVHPAAPLVNPGELTSSFPNFITPRPATLPPTPMRIVLQLNFLTN